MNTIQSFTDLKSWQEAHKLLIVIYEIVKQFPQIEQYALNDQLRRAAVSITSNIAEGFSRQYNKEKVQFYRTALASLTEVQNQILITKDVKYISKEQFDSTAELSVTVSKLLNGLIKKSRTLIHNS